MPEDTEEIEFPTVPGLNLEQQKIDDADERNFPYESLALGGPLPLEFSIETVTTSQRAIDSCVGHAVSGQKGDQEKVQISPRDLWARCKEKQNFEGYGTSINIALKALIEYGACEYGMVDEDSTVSREKYMRVTRNEAIIENASIHKSGSFWFMRSNAYDVIKEALMNEKISLVTSLQWFKEYNKTVDGFLPRGKTPSNGHCIRMRGWFMHRFKDGLDEVWIFKNSFGEKYGKNGDFYIRKRDLPQYGLGNFYVTVDIPRDIAELIKKYAGKLVKSANDPKVYLIEKDTKRHIEDELAFWLYTSTGLADVLIMDAGDLALFREGAPIKKTDFDENLLRVIRNMGQLYESNPEYAKKLFKF